MGHNREGERCLREKKERINIEKMAVPHPKRSSPLRRARSVGKQKKEESAMKGPWDPAVKGPLGGEKVCRA